MKYYFKILLSFIIVFLLLYEIPVKADLPLQGKVIVVDAGHGGKDPGTSYGSIYEKDINLSISLYLEECLSKYGATVVLTRDSDADLSYGAEHRKKTDFDNRIKIINNKYTDMYLSIHLNYLTNTKYYGAQVFYNKDNEVIGIKGIPIENFKQLDTLEYRMNYRYSNVERIELELTEDPVENIEIESDLVNFTFDNRKVIWFIAGLIVLWNIPGWIF